MASSVDGWAALAARLAGAESATLVPCSGGGNNRVFRVDTHAGVFALKLYPRTPADDRDRIGHEFAGLRYAAAAAPGAVPQPLAADACAGAALYEWIAGDPVVAPQAPDVSEAIRFLQRLHAGRRTAGAAELPVAAEAILAGGDLLAQLDRRLERLGAVAPTDPDLERLLAGRLVPAVERYRGRAGVFGVLAPGERTLSPSDFGFHNALRRDGRIVFLDFEYFGWDDPAKLICDVLWHPGMVLDQPLRRQFLRGMTDIYGKGNALRARLRAYAPLIALRWAAIVLGEFVPETWERRVCAGGSLDRADAKRRQLAKAHAILDRLELEMKEESNVC